MAKLQFPFKLIFASQTDVVSEPLLPGSMIITDQGRQYLDRPDGGGRMELTDMIIIITEASRLAIMTPIDTFYYVIETAKLYRYQVNQWHCLNTDPQFIGGDGKVLIDYLPGYGGELGLPGEPGKPGAPGITGTQGGVVILGPGGTVPPGYLAIATPTISGTMKLGSKGGAARYGMAADAGLNNVTNDAQVKLSDIEDHEPDGISSSTNVTSANCLHRLLGQSLGELSTNSKTIVGAINELYHLLKPNI